MAQFKRGFDVRRHVPTNKGVWEFRTKLAEMLRSKSLDAFNYLVEVLNNPELDPKLRKECAVEILNRGLGAPVNTLVIESLDNADEKDVSTLSTQDLERLVMKLTPVNVLEGELVEVSDAGTGETATKNSLKQAGIDV